MKMVKDGVGEIEGEDLNFGRPKVLKDMFSYEHLTVVRT